MFVSEPEAENIMKIVNFLNKFGKVKGIEGD